jgi:hypothetical protein
MLLITSGRAMINTIPAHTAMTSKNVDGLIFIFLFGLKFIRLIDKPHNQGNNRHHKGDIGY